MANYVSLNGLKDAANAFKEKVGAVDVLVGVGLGMVVGSLAKGFLLARASKPDAAEWLKKLAPYGDVLGGSGAGLALFLAQKGNKRAAGHLVGAVGGAVIPRIASVVGEKAATALKLQGYGAYVLAPVNGYGRHMGMIVPDAAYGMIVPDASFGEASREYQLAQLAAFSEQNSEDDEYVMA